MVMAPAACSRVPCLQRPLLRTPPAVPARRSAAPLRAPAAPPGGPGRRSSAGSRRAGLGAARLGVRHVPGQRRAGGGARLPGALRPAQHRAAPRPAAGRAGAGAHRAAQQEVSEPAAGAGSVPGFELRPGQGEPVPAAAAGERQSLTGHKVPGAAGDEGGVLGKAAASGDLPGEGEPTECPEPAPSRPGCSRGGVGGAGGEVPGPGAAPGRLPGILSAEPDDVPPPQDAGGEAGGTPAEGEAAQGVPRLLQGAASRPAEPSPSPSCPGAEHSLSQAVPAPLWLHACPAGPLGRHCPFPCARHPSQPKPASPGVPRKPAASVSLQRPLPGLPSAADWTHPPAEPAAFPRAARTPVSPTEAGAAPPIAWGAMGCPDTRRTRQPAHASSLC